MVAQAIDTADEDPRAPAWQWRVAVGPCVRGAFLPGSKGVLAVVSALLFVHPSVQKQLGHSFLSRS